MFIDKGKETPQDWDAVARFLSDRRMTLDRNVEIRQFASGIANLNYFITIDGLPAVFRRPPSNDAPPGAYDFRRQHNIMSRLGKLLPTTPLGLAYCDDTSVIGVPFLISEFRNGAAIGSELPPALVDVENIGSKLSATIIHALVGLHRISPDEAGLADLGKAQGFIGRQSKGGINAQHGSCPWSRCARWRCCATGLSRISRRSGEQRWCISISSWTTCLWIRIR